MTIERRDWERYKEAKKLREQGFTLKSIGAAMSVSASRVRAMLDALERRERDIAWEAEHPKWWKGLNYHTKGELQRLGFDSREACIALTADELPMWRGSVVFPGWEEDKTLWRYSRKKLSLKMVNEVRAWLGVAPYAPPPRAASAAELERASRLLKHHGWRVEQP